MNEQQLILMRDGKVSTVLIKLGLPAIIGMMSGSLYNVADAYFVGGLGTAQMGAVSVTFPLIMILIGIGLTFGSGAGSYISRLLGENKGARASKTASTAVFTSLLTGACTIAVLLLFLDKILVMLGATETILPYARAYALIYLSGGIFQIFYVTMNNIVISEGASRITMTAMLISVGLNIVLDPVFIYLLAWGVKGAAIATVLSQAIACLFFVRYILAGKGYLKISLRYFSKDKVIYSQILKIGVPVFLLQLATSLSIALTNAAAGNFGDTAVAAMGVVTRICTLGAYGVFGYVKGFQPMAGYSYGARNFERLNESIRISLLWTTIYCGAAALIMIFLPEFVVAPFSKNDYEMIAVGTKALRANGFIFITFGFQMVYSTLFLALGKAKVGGILSICRQGIFFIPLILIFSRLFGLNGVIYTQFAADVCTVVITALFAAGLRNKLKCSLNSDTKKNETRV
jgi:putative MATE family efflux protein